MVDANEAKIIAEDVQARYATAVEVDVITKQELMPSKNNRTTTWKTLDAVPPSFFDFYRLYLVDPNENWPQELQVDAGPGGSPGWSKNYTFYLIAKELGHKQHCPGSKFGKMFNRATLKEVQPGWEDYQPFFDGLIVDVINMTSLFVQSRFEDMANLIPQIVRQKNGEKIKQLFSNGGDIITWEEVFTRVAFGVAEKVIYGKSPNQGPPETESAGPLWPGLKNTPEGKAQMLKAMEIYDAVFDCALASTEGDTAEFLDIYRFIAEKLRDILGKNAAFIIPPLPLTVSNDLTDKDALGMFEFLNEAKEIVELQGKINKAISAENAGTTGGGI